MVMVVIMLATTEAPSDSHHIYSALYKSTYLSVCLYLVAASVQLSLWWTVLIIAVAVVSRITDVSYVHRCRLESRWCLLKSCIMYIVAGWNLGGVC